MLLRNSRPKPANAEDGYLLLTVLVMIFLMLLALSIAAPRVAKQIQRDKEQEAVERGLQYKRAIQLYYKKFGAYPSDIKQLENTNQIRFLRKRYKDPITGKDDWRLIHMGEAKVPPMGFFGQPLQAGMSSASTGPGLGTGSGGTPGLYANSDASGTNGSANGTPGTSGGQRVAAVPHSASRTAARTTRAPRPTLDHRASDSTAPQLPVPAAWAAHRQAPTGRAPAAPAVARPSAADRLWVSGSR